MRNPGRGSLLAGSLLMVVLVAGMTVATAPVSIASDPEDRPASAAKFEAFIDPALVTIQVGETQRFRAEASLDGTPVPAVFEWSLSNSSRARLDSSSGTEANVTGLDRGEVFVRVNASYQGETDDEEAKLTVLGLKDLYIELSQTSLNLKVGEEAILIANCTDRYGWWVDASYWWAQSGDVVEVSPSGDRATVKAVAEGTGVVMAAGSYDGNQETFNVSVTVTGIAPVQPGPVLLRLEHVALLTGMGAGAAALLVLFGTEVGVLAAMSLMMPLFTRIKRERTLDHFVRGQIYQYVKMNPGASYSTIKRKLALRNGTLTYHLKMLQSQGFLRAEREGLHCFFFPAEMPKPATRAVWLLATQARLAGLLASSPGVTQADLVRASGLKQQVVSYNMLALERAGVVRVVREGRLAKYWYVEPPGGANGNGNASPAARPIGPGEPKIPS